MDINLGEHYITEVCPRMKESSLKVYHVLLLLRRKRGKRFIEITDKDLSKMTGLSYFGINSGISQLEGLGLIQVLKTKYNNRKTGQQPTEYIVKKPNNIKL